MSVTDVAMRLRVSDPKPAYCSACHRGADSEVRFVDFDAAFDAGAYRSTDSLAFVEGSDDLHLCFECVRSAAELIGFKPELHSRQLREIRRLEIENEHWKATVQRTRRELDVQVQSGLGEVKRGPGRPRKQVS